MSTLLKKIEAFRENKFPGLKDKYAKLKDGQQPPTLFVTCSDSRLVPSEFTETSGGELFVIRNAGNLIPVYDEGTSSSESLTIEYAISVLGIKEVVICGHVSCGAMGGILSLDQLKGHKCIHHHLENVSKQFDTEVFAKIKEHEPAKSLELLIEENVKRQMKNLLSYDFIKAKYDKDEINISGWVYDFVNAKAISTFNLKEVL